MSIRKIKVALVHPQYRPDGGAEKAIICTLEALLQKKAKVKIVSREWAEQGTNAEIVQCDPFYIGRLWREWSFTRKVGRLLADMDIDLVQSQIRLPMCDIYRAGGGVHKEWLKQRDRILGFLRRFWTRHSAFQRYKIHAEAKLYADPHLKAVICNSQMVKNEIQTYFNVPKEKIHVIYNSVDLDQLDFEKNLEARKILRSKLGLNDGQTVFLFVGSGFERKGLSMLLESMALLPENCCLIVVGTDKQFGKYVRKSRKLGISKKVFFMGIKRDMRPFYAAADAFVLPTLYDAFANTVLEAMAASLPVITSYKCGAVDLIQNGINGFVCDSQDKVKIVRYMETLMDPPVRERIGKAGRTTVEGFTVENMSSSLYELYEKIMG